MLLKAAFFAGLLALIGSASAQQPSTAPNASSPPAPQAQPIAPAAQTTNPETLPPDSKSLEVVKVVKAVYPLEAERDELQGQVVIKFHVSETGDVEQAEVVSGNSVLAGAAVNAAKKWKFKPFIRNGHAEKVATNIRFDFAFKDKVTDVKIAPSAASSADGNDGSQSPKRVRVSAGVTQGLVLHKVAPVYPPDAKRARIQGTVVLAAIIGKDGRIKDLHVLSGPAALTDAAVGAVEQWQYRPYLLMGEPVEVDTTVTVTFTLR